MVDETRKVEVCYVGSGATWTVALTLMVLATLLEEGGAMMAWSLFVALFAMVWSMHIIVAKAKRSVVRSMAREIAFALRDNPEVGGLHAVP
jgi:hypothetical protein